MESIATLLRRTAHPGHITWIGLRPGRRETPIAVEQASLTTEGLDGDHARPGKRALTLIQAEHLPLIAGFLGAAEVSPATLRRNVAVAGINLLALRHRRVRLGRAVIEITGLCAPCSRMEEALGTGGYNAMRGHGGVTATVLQPGEIALGDTVEMLPDG